MTTNQHNYKNQVKLLAAFRSVMLLPDFLEDSYAGKLGCRRGWLSLSSPVGPVGLTWNTALLRWASCLSLELFCHPYDYYNCWGLSLRVLDVLRLSSLLELYEFGLRFPHPSTSSVTSETTWDRCCLWELLLLLSRDTEHAWWSYC